MTKIALAGIVVLFFLSAFVSQGKAWGAIVWQLTGAAWVIYCFNRY
jgi:hypothetical protein